MSSTTCRGFFFFLFFSGTSDFGPAAELHSRHGKSHRATFPSVIDARQFSHLLHVSRRRLLTSPPGVEGTGRPGVGGADLDAVVAADLRGVLVLKFCPSPRAIRVREVSCSLTS